MIKARLQSRLPARGRRQTHRPVYVPVAVDCRFSQKFCQATRSSWRPRPVSAPVAFLLRGFTVFGMKASKRRNSHMSLGCWCYPTTDGITQVTTSVNSPVLKRRVRGRRGTDFQMVLRPILQSTRRIHTATGHALLFDNPGCDRDEKRRNNLVDPFCRRNNTLTAHFTGISPYPIESGVIYSDDFPKKSAGSGFRIAFQVDGDPISTAKRLEHRCSETVRTSRYLVPIQLAPRTPVLAQEAAVLCTRMQDQHPSSEPTESHWPLLERSRPSGWTRHGRLRTYLLPAEKDYST